MTGITLHCPFTNHRFRIVTEWVEDVILQQIGLKCFSMRMTLDLLHEFANTKFSACFTTACGNPDTLKSMSVFLALCEQTDGLSTLHRSPRACVGASQPNKTPFFRFPEYGWVCWESSLPPTTSGPNSFIQLSVKEIFGRRRGDAYTFSYVISPVCIIIAFGIQ